MNLSVFFMIFAFFTLPTHAFAENQVHRIFGLNSETFTNCESEIDEIAAQIGRSQGVTITASYCETSSSTNRVTGLIGYVANEPLKEVSTYTPGAIYAPKGIYSSKQSCESRLQDDVLTFEANTGLNMTYAFCAKELLTSGDTWYPNITAFGLAKKVPFRSSWHSNTPHGTDMTQIRDKLNQHFSDRSAEFINVNYKDTGAAGRLTAFYYVLSEYAPLAIYESVVATIPGLSACASTSARVDEDGVQIGEKQAIYAYCTSGYSGPTRFELSILHEGMEFLDSVQHSQSFSSLELCENSRSSIESELRLVHGDKLVTTVCGLPKFTVSSRGPFFVIGAKHY